MEKFKKITQFTLKREFSQPKEIPRTSSRENNKNSFENDDDLGKAFLTIRSDCDSRLSPNSPKTQSEGFLRKLAVNLNITQRRGSKELKNKKKLSPTPVVQNDPQLDQESQSEEPSWNISDCIDFLPDDLNMTGEEGSEEVAADKDRLVAETRNAEDIDAILNSLTNFSCYDIIQPNTKLVILDNSLTLKKALDSMMETGVRACPLWDNLKQEYVGMLTITDFIRILQKFYKGPDVPMKVFTEATLKDWQDIIHSRKEFFQLALESRLIDACRILLENKIHRLPVVDRQTGTIFSILNQKPILKFIYNILKQKSVRVSSLDISIREAGVGSFNNIAVAKKDTKVIEILNRFLEEGVTALPVVDSEGKLTNIYSKFDVFSLESFFDLEITVEEATGHKIYFEGVYNCRGSDSVYEVLEKLVLADVNRLVIVDESQRVEGMVTVSDLIDYVVLRHVETKAGGRHARGSETPPPVWWSLQ